VSGVPINIPNLLYFAANDTDAVYIFEKLLIIDWADGIGFIVPNVAFAVKFILPIDFVSFMPIKLIKFWLSVCNMPSLFSSSLVLKPRLILPTCIWRSEFSRRCSKPILRFLIDIFSFKDVSKARPKSSINANLMFWDFILCAIAPLTRAVFNGTDAVSDSGTNCAPTGRVARSRSSIPCP